jgi:hypothetical protein
VGLGVILVFALALTGLYVVRSSHAATYTVCPVGCPYTSISAAVAAAADNAVVTVGPGIYGPSTGDSYVTLTQGITLQGAGAGVSIINTGGTTTLPNPIYGTINVTVPGTPVAARAFTIEGFTIEGASANNGSGEPFLIDIQADTNPGDSFTITNNQFLESPTLDPNLGSDFSVGVYSLESTATFSITHNVFTGMFQGTFLEDQLAPATISNNDYNGLLGSSDSTPTLYYGEGVFELSDIGQTITNQTISNNTFENYGGVGIAFDAGYSNQFGPYQGDISGVTVSGNRFNMQGATDAYEGDGPAIFMHGFLQSSAASHARPLPWQRTHAKVSASPKTSPKGTATPVNGTVSNMTVQNNLMLVSGPGRGIVLENSFGAGNTFTGNLLSASGSPTPASGVSITGSVNTPGISFTGNQISGFATGIATDTLASGGTFTASQNCVAGNTTYGANVGVDGATFTAQQNWWGAASGPNPPGSGDNVTGAIDTSSFLTAPATVCQGPVSSGLTTGPTPLLVGNDINLGASTSDATTGNFPITAAQYNLDGGPYHALAAQDGSFDTVTEAVDGTVPGIGTPGDHTLCVRGTDLGGNVGAPACVTIMILVPDSLGLQGNASNIFSLRNSNNTGIANTTLAFGQAGDIPLSGDWTGKGYDSVGVYRPANSTFYLRNTNTSGLPDITVQLGVSGDIPVVGDWYGTGTQTVGVWNPTTHRFTLLQYNMTGSPFISLVYGASGDIPLAGDWTGKGYASIGVYRPSAHRFLLRNSNTTGAADITATYGIAGDIPIVGEWTHQGKTTLGVYRPSNNGVYLRNSNSTGNADIVYQYGSGAGLTPVVGEWQTSGLTKPGR